ncbi:MAG: type IV toxin-antitoxin system AbiEi family antitoxin, partial [Vicinamibacteria bacterium]
SLRQVANVKSLLLDKEWVASGSDGIFLREPEPLLREWAAAYELRKNKPESFYSLKDVDEVERELAKRCQEIGLRYALTAFSGAVRLAPAVRYRRAYAFVDRPGTLADLLEIKRVDSGENVLFLTPYDDGVFYDSRSIDDLRVVSPIQLFLDLSSIRGRGEEAAEAVLEQEIRPKW